MKRNTLFAVLLTVMATSLAEASPDPRVRAVIYEKDTVVTVIAMKGVTTHVELGADERIEFVATGVASECGREEDTWCVTAPKNGTQLFIKPKSRAQGENNIAIATNLRAYSLRFVVDPAARPTYRLSFVFPSKLAFGHAAQPLGLMPAAAEMSEGEKVKLRLQQAPSLVNAEYSIAIGKKSEEIAPTMVWDDGRFTFFQFPNNREVPAVFQVNSDEEESVVNAKMEGDFLVADRVGRHFYLRRGRAVVGVYNEAFDVDGIPPRNGTTVDGIERVFRAGVLQ